MADTSATLLLRTEPIGKLLLRYSLPAIAAMVVFSLYNIIDSIFIGHGVGPLAISGLAITFPVMNLTFALVLLVGIGGFAKEAWWREASLSAPLETAVTASRPWLPEPLAKRLRYR